MYGLYLQRLLLCVSTQNKLLHSFFYLYIFNRVFIGPCRYSIPREFPDDCVSVFDNVTCEYIVHKKDNQSMICPIYISVGK